MITRKIYNAIYYRYKKSLNFFRKNIAARQLKKFKEPYKLHVGCGAVKFDDWINIDIENNYGKTDIIWDAAKGFDFIESQSCSLIYSEHFLEHLTIEEAKIFLPECYRILTKNGVIRIAMPSLEYVVNKYQSEDWKDQDWLSWKGHEFIQTRAEMINISFRWWGHKWLYDREELHRRLKESGFTEIKDVEWCNSGTPELSNRETRKDSILICEATRR